MKTYTLFFYTCIAMSSYLPGTSAIAQEYEKEIDAIPFIINSTEVSSPFAGGFDASKAAFVDIDNDGDYDLFVGGLGGNISFFKNVGSAKKPNFAYQTSNYQRVSVEERSTPTFADIEGDGDFDLLLRKIAPR